MISYLEQNQLERARTNVQTRISVDARGEKASVLENFRLFAATLSYSPSYEQILRDYVRNFTGRGVPKSRPVQTLNLEVILSPQQSATGGHLPIRIPVFEPCPQCEGTGRSGFFTCDQCAGDGMRVGFHPLDVLIPVRLKQDMLVPVSLRRLGVSKTYLNIRVRPSAGGALV